MHTEIAAAPTHDVRAGRDRSSTSHAARRRSGSAGNAPASAGEHPGQDLGEDHGQHQHAHAHRDPGRHDQLADVGGSQLAQANAPAIDARMNSPSRPTIRSITIEAIACVFLIRIRTR